MRQAKAAAALIAADKPLFTAVHLSSLDETEHTGRTPRRKPAPTWRSWTASSAG